jgi:hypothetical protein
VPALLSLEADAQESMVRVEALSKHQCHNTTDLSASPRYASGLTLAAIKVQERNLLEARLLSMHAQLREHLNRAQSAESADALVDQEKYEKAIRGLNAYISSMAAFLTANGADMKTLNKKLSQQRSSNTHFAGLVRTLKEALCPKQQAPAS